ncbi:hypothetical protein SAY86_029071 [Trapa natans]|uniref:Uncharacterized protein n=1 Tax=Trapa natans TaxID=22666 RepID=A0AAN7RCS0_TRANT|nr:hypothetical protein SAY86_029071 [Trapa natans]
MRSCKTPIVLVQIQLSICGFQAVMTGWLSHSIGNPNGSCIRLKSIYGSLGIQNQGSFNQISLELYIEHLGILPNGSAFWAESTGGSSIGMPMNH